MNSPTFESELQVARSAARAAGAAAMLHYGSASATDKSDRSPVTAADHAANDVIVPLLRQHFPADAILSEESADSADRLAFERVWIVDPLDGTKEFLSQNGEFSIMIGLAIEGEAVLGVVFAPATDTMLFAARGSGAWIEKDGSVRQLARSAGDAASPPRLVGSRSHADPALQTIQQHLGIVDVEPCGSVGLKCARVAEGRRDIYVHPVPYLKEWDTCAPEVVLREAGGWVSDCAGNELRYNKRETNQPLGIVATAPGLQESVIAITEVMVKEWEPAWT
jgi:3'(2'), 5'-bisphosphate nucleotidase